MADSSNSTAGSQSTGSQTSTSSNGSTTSSNRNFSGGLPGLGGQSWGSFTSNGGRGSSSETDAAHSSGVQGPGMANGNFGSSWSNNGNSGSGSGDYTYNNTSYSNNKSKPAMTVDEVYGKSNQSIAEKQGDYTASSNEKSGVETSTFGKQDIVTVTPESVTENKGLVDNAAIDSIKGLNFQQKDKESQDVMEARKSRDEAESEDKANQMRESLKAKTDESVDEKAINKFQIGDRDEDVAAAKTKADEAEKALQDVVNQINDIQNKEKQMNSNVAAAKEKLEEVEARRTASYEALAKVTKEAEAKGIINAETARSISKGTITNEEFDSINWGTMSENAESAKAEFQEAFEAFFEVNRAYKAAMEAEEAYLEKASTQLEQLVAKRETLTDEFQAAYADYNSMINEKFVGAEENVPSNAAASIQDAREALESSNLSPEQKAQAEQTLADIEANRTDVIGAAEKLTNSLENANPADIDAYIRATKQYEENLEAALKGNPFTKTDFNESFVKSIAKANDFEVTLADGTKTAYSKFAADMATKSPKVAKAMYEVKAQKYEAENHPILAKIERAKAALVDTWLGSKLTQADNQVRGQFNQMAKTNMRATYATYNNVLSDPNASPEAKAEASAAINKANGLMTASAALQASTGFLSGIGDSMKDGVYGVTDPAALNAYQKTLNAIDNFTKITLGLGVTPGANKAYQNMYYMAGAKVNESGLFSRDFDRDGFALCQEYGNNAAAGMIAGAGELATGVALFFNPAMSGIGLNLVIDAIQTFTNGLYGVQKDARKSEKYTQEVLSYFKEAESIAAETGNKEALDAISSGITQIENFELKSDEVGNLDNWIEGSGSNTAINEKFNQSLSYDEWLKLIEADPTMRDYAKKLIAEKKEK